FELAKRYGGVPLIGDRILTLHDDLRLPRNTFEETIDYIVTECDAVKDHLRPDPVSTTDFGRITKMVALTLKGKALLYAASTLNNPAGDRQKWMKAKNALAEAIVQAGVGGFALNP